MSDDMRLVLVEWIDSSSHPTGWHDLERIKRDGSATYCQSVGWLLHRTKDHITLVPHISGNEGYVPFGKGDLSIPTIAIKSIADLAKQRKKPRRRAARRRVLR